MLLKEIKSAVGERELTIAAPGREGDLIAYTAEQVPIINEIVDAVNVSIIPHAMSFLLD